MIVDGVLVDHETNAAKDATRLIKSLSTVFNNKLGDSVD